MLDIKKTLIKILESIRALNGRRTSVKQIASNDITLAAGATTWVDVSFPSDVSGKDVRYSGYYVSSGYANVYSCQMLSDSISFAVKNLGSSSITFKVYFNLQY